MKVFQNTAVAVNVTGLVWAFVQERGSSVFSYLKKKSSSMYACACTESLFIIKYRGRELSVFKNLKPLIFPFYIIADLDVANVIWMLGTAYALKAQPAPLIREPRFSGCRSGFDTAT